MIIGGIISGILNPVEYHLMLLQADFVENARKENTEHD